MTFVDNQPIVQSVTRDKDGYEVTVLLDNDGYDSPVANRLAVNVGSPTMNIGDMPDVVIKPQFPGNPTRFSIDFVRNNGSPSLNVDGSDTPVVFSFDADAYQDTIVHELRVGVTTQDFVFDGTKFGLKDSLDNGVLIEVVLSGQAYELANIKLNEDWLFFSNSSAGVGTILNNTGPKDVMAVGFGFESVTLSAGSSDQIRVTIRDDLSGGGATALNYFQIKVFGSFEV